MQTGKARGLGSAVQQVVQGFEQFFAVIPAERQFRAVGQLDGVIAMKDRLQFPDVIDVDEIGPIIREQANKSSTASWSVPARWTSERTRVSAPEEMVERKHRSPMVKTRAARPIIGCDKWRKPLCIL